MMKIIPLMVFFLMLGLSDARAELSKKDVEEIRKIVREEITYAITQVEKRLDQKIDDLDKRVSDKIADLDKRVSDTHFYLQMLIGVVCIFGGAFVVGWVKLSSKVAATEATVTEHLKKAEKDSLIVLQKEEQKEEIGQLKGLIEAFQDSMKELNRRMDRIERKMAQLGPIRAVG